MYKLFNNLNKYVYNYIPVLILNIIIVTTLILNYLVMYIYVTITYKCCSYLLYCSYYYLVFVLVYVMYRIY